MRSPDGIGSGRALDPSGQSNDAVYVLSQDGVAVGFKDPCFSIFGYERCCSLMKRIGMQSRDPPGFVTPF